MKSASKTVLVSTEVVLPTDEQLDSFIDKFDVENAALIRSCRSAMWKRLPRAIELVYDNYNFLAIGFCTAERTSSCIVSLACGANGVSLSFYNGASLPDPGKILLGSGNQNRFVRLKSAEKLAEPAVESLIQAAIVLANPPLSENGGGYTVIKSISAKQRPRRRSI